MRNILFAVGLAGGVLSAAFSPSAMAAEEPKPVSDIQTNLIDHTEVVDDQNILFYMRGKDIYLNTLPYPCSGLRIEGGFAYKTSIPVLTDKDIITVLRRGGSCGLGGFHPVTKAQAEKIKDEARAKRKGKTAEMPAAPSAPAQ